jgi:hypothetical protein
MKKNIGSTDRIIRVILAFIIIGLYLTKVFTFPLAAISLFAVSVLVITSFISFCPIYYPFGIITRKKSKQQDIK